ncbi:TonB-dependent receptor plug domain-containing protein [Flaviaesturariibacter flavus]|nr:TonB-dependent receptor [Flaviaesturariibacter flavus]
MKKQAFVVAAIAFSSPLLAQQAADSATTLDEVVVTANKFPKSAAETGKEVTVIGRDVLDRNSGRSVSEVLAVQAGFRVVGSQNNLGTNQDLYLRGAGVGKTLILIDGIPAYDPSGIDQAFDLNSVPLDNIERVEIVKGALSTLYGSDAIAGVVNIITRKGSNGTRFNGTLAGGSFGTLKGSGNLSGSYGQSQYSIGYSRLSASNGFSSARDSSAKGAGFDNDRYRQDVLNASLTTALSSSVSLRLYGQHSRYIADADAGSFLDDKDYTITTRNYLAGASATWQYGKHTLYVNYNYNALERAYLDDSTSVPGFVKFAKRNFIGRTHFGEAYTRIAANKNIDLLAGVDARLQNSDQSDFYRTAYGDLENRLGQDSARTEQYSAFASVILKNLGSFNLELGGRLNHHTEYGNNFTFSFNPSYTIGREVKFFVNIASGFKAPSLYQIYNSEYGGPALKAERSINADFGAQYQPTRDVMLRATYFNRDVKNGLDYNYATNNYFNYNRQKDHGLELEAQGKWGKFFGNANYTWVTGKVNTLGYVDLNAWPVVVKGDTTYNNLFRRPEHSYNLTAGYNADGRWILSATLRHIGKRLEGRYAAEPLPMAAYSTLDIYGEYRILPALRLFADLRNVTDEQFTEVYGYNSRRFNFMAGLTYNIH